MLDRLRVLLSIAHVFDVAFRGLQGSTFPKCTRRPYSIVSKTLVADRAFGPGKSTCKLSAVAWVWNLVPESELVFALLKGCLC